MINTIFTLLQAGLKGYKVQTPNDLEALYPICCEQGIQAIVWDAFDSYDQIPRFLKFRWALSVETIEKTYNHQYKVASEVANILQDHNIKTVVLKGIDASLNYPKPEHRPCGDLDCFLFDGYTLGNQILKEQGAEVEDKWYKHSHINYKGLVIENHQYCTAIRASRKLKNFERKLQHILRSNPLTPIADTALLSPCPLFCALFLTYHANAHFLSEGIAIRHLCDWAMFLDKNASKVDWTQFNEIASEFGLKTFADTMTRLAQKYLKIEGYTTENDNLRDDFLLNEMLYNQQHIYSTKGTKFQKRFEILWSINKNSKRYKLFSDSSFFAQIVKLVYGFIFDRNPKI